MVATAISAGRSSTITPEHRTPVLWGETNVANWERVVSGMGGALLLLKGLDRGGLLGIGMAGLGGALLYRGISGQCPMYRSLGISSATREQESFKGVMFTASVTINKPRDEVYRNYRDHSQHTKFSRMIESVHSTPGGTTTWTLKGPMGTKIPLEGEIFNERPNELCAWRSPEGATLHHAGSVRFTPAPGGKGTEVHLTWSFEPPLGPLGRSIGRALRALPAEWAEDELMRFKQWMEAGEVATTQGQPRG